MVLENAHKEVLESHGKPFSVFYMHPGSRLLTFLLIDNVNSSLMHVNMTFDCFYADKEY